MTLEELREAYQFETSRKNQIESSVSFLVGILMALAGVFGTMISKFQHYSDYLSWVFLTFVVVACVLLGFAFWNIKRVYGKYNVHYLPHWGEITKYEAELVAYYEQDKSQAGQAIVEFQQYLKETYVGVIDNNAWTNDSKVVYLHNARAFLIWAAIVISLSSVPYIVNEKMATQSVSKVELVNPVIKVESECKHADADINEKQ